MRIGVIAIVVLGCSASPPVVPVKPPVPAALPVIRAPAMLSAAPPALGARSVSFTLHKFLAEVGKERDTYVAVGDGGVDAKAVFSYRDRGATVALAAEVAFDRDGSVRRYRVWGETSRLTVVDDRIERRPDGAYDVSHEGAVHRVAPAGVAVMASGYAPMLLQDLMLRAWEQHGRPAKLAMLPAGEVSIVSRGTESYDKQDHTKLALEHVAISGLVWGVEDVWLDDKHQLVAVVTRDAEFDHHEAAREGFDWMLPALAKASGVDGVARLATGVTAQTGAIALAGARLIDGTGRPAIEDAVVVVDGDRIVAAGPRAKVTIPPAATTIDVAGMSIVPGLWDMHAHVEQVEQAAVYLGAGVTTVRDMGNILEFITGMRDAIDSGKGLGPRIIVDGLVDGVGDGALGTIRIKNRGDIQKVIDGLRAAGCAEVKIYSSIAPELVRPIIAYAHAHGMRAVGHVPEGMKSQEAIDAGYDSISHVGYLLDVFPRLKDVAPDDYWEIAANRDFNAPEFRRLVDSVVAHHVVIDDTVALFEPFFFTNDVYAKREPGVATMPPQLPPFNGLDNPKVADAAGRAFASYIAMLHMLHERGVTLVAGTDIAVPGHSLHRELELYVMAGFTPMQAIQAATSVPARYMHRDKELGTVEAGKRADLVVVAGNPLDNINDIRNTKLVIARGRVYDSAALWQLSGFGRIGVSRSP